MTSLTHQPASHDARAVTPLGVVLVLTALNALSAGLVTSGLFFAAQTSYGFGTAGNYLLGLVIGTSYTAGASVAGRVVARSRGRTRRVLVPVLAALALATQWPLLLPGEPLALWLVALTYGPAAALLWPIVQSYVSGGRSGPGLRRALGQFNMTWGMALVVGFGLLGPWLETAPEATLSALGGLQLLSAVLLLGFAPSPGSGAAGHAAARLEAPPPGYVELRAVLQGLLPLTNLLSFALAPFLPEVFARLGLPSAARASFAVVWLLPRALTFGALARWHGWYGKRAAAWVGAGCLLGGFALAVLAPWIDRGDVGLALEVVGLVAFGVGMATIYTAAFYYAQAAGGAAVGAGGRHEALLGLGATLGPLLGLVVCGASALGAVSEAAFEPVLACFCVLIAATVGWRALRT